MGNGIEKEMEGFLIDRGIPVMGIAAPRELPSVPGDFSPRSILGNVASVVCYGVPIPGGVIHAERDAPALYWRYCNMTYRLLDTATNRLCLLIEQKGHLAAPIYGCFPWRVSGNKYWGLLPLVYWAEETGLGRLTRCGLAANPTYGTRMLFGGVVTTMELKPTGKIRKEPCPEGCFDCSEACPVGAIAKTGKVDQNLCIRRSGANPLLSHLLRDREAKEKFPMETLLNTVAVDDHGSYTCFKCLEACPLNG
jgi:epoxyqueuosine reductase QueG